MNSFFMPLKENNKILALGWIAFIFLPAAHPGFIGHQFFLVKAFIVFFVGTLLELPNSYRLLFAWLIYTYTIGSPLELSSKKEFLFFLFSRELAMTGFLAAAIASLWRFPHYLFQYLFYGSFLVIVTPLSDFLNISLLACLNVLTFPFVPWYLFPLSIIALLVSKSSTAGLATAIMVTWWLWGKRKFSSIVILLIGGVLLALLDPSLLGTHRWGQYKIFLRHFFAESPMVWFRGKGLASFVWWGPRKQMLEGKTEAFYVWAHSDWLQILIESGLIGLSLALWAYFWTVKNTSGKVQLSVIGYGVVMLFYYPWHSPILFLLGCMLISQKGKDNVCCDLGAPNTGRGV